MAEIQPDELSEVRSFLEQSFELEREPAQQYAAIALLLSDEDRFAAALTKVDDWLAAIFEEANRQGLFEQRYGESDVRQEKKGGFNVTSRLLNAAANSLGWGTGGSLVMSGFTHPPDFVRIVQRRLMWKDMVASGHGEFTHIIQWLALYTEFGPLTPGLYAGACNHQCVNKAYNPTGKTRPYLWDFIVDCFPAPPEAQWDKDLRSATARSPTMANASIFKTRFLGERLRQRYERKGYVKPVDSQANYSSTSAHGHDKHLVSGGDSPVALEGEQARDNRKIFEGQKGFKGLLTTGYPKPNTEKKQQRTGYLFARGDQALQQGSSLMMIAQQHTLA
jgi:hypothetical protein